jgi:Flp pilus assembly protein TadG
MLVNRLKIETVRWVFMSKLARGFRHWCRDTRGVAMVEFAIIVTLLLTIVAGIIDLGHAFYLQHIVTNASREGARYGVAYRVDPSNPNQRLLPINLNIKDYVLNTLKYKNLLPSDADVQVLGPGATSGNYGDELDVTVTATKTWFILDNFIPILGSTKALSATTAMRCE